MKLLICTQAVDKNHPILGFFHRWIEEFAKHCEEVHVICLQKGEYTLPSNVHVYSLGKEEEKGKLIQLYRFYKYICELHKRYDSVFVHMNQIYVILGALVWGFMGKHIGFWYAHGSVSVSLWIAEKITNVIFTSTEQGFRLDSSKKHIVGQGIDFDQFNMKGRGNSAGEVLRLVTVGRISPSKNIETLLEACLILAKEGLDFKLTIVGSSYTPFEKEYERRMKQKVEIFGLVDHIVWIGGIPQSQLPYFLHNAEIFIQDSTTRSLDKALLEALACGCIVVTSNPSYAAFASEFTPQFIYKEHDYKDLCKIIKKTFNNHAQVIDGMEKLRSALHKKHAIENLINTIVSKY